MKNLNIIILIIIGLFSQNYLEAQKAKKVSIYRTWISLNDRPSEMKGVLYEIRDSSILVSNSLQVSDYYLNNFELIDLSVNKINKIKIRKKNKIGKSMLFGTLIGAGLGAIIGFTDGDDKPTGTWDFFNYTAEEKAAIGALTGGILGSGIGALIGTIKVNVPIHGDLNTFKKNKNNLMLYTIKKD